MPDSYAITPDNKILIANGIDLMLSWDGLGDMQPAGVLAPTLPPALAFSTVGDITGTYYVYVRFLDSEGNQSNLSPLGGPAVASNNGLVSYTNVQLPTEARVTRRQILRNTAGQTAVFYVDIDTNDITSTSFSSTLDDETLGNNPFQALLDANFNILANLYSPPPAHKSVLAHHLDRMFAACEVEYPFGSVVVTNGSLTVQGVGTFWPLTFINRFLYVNGATQSYQITGVNVTTQVITLGKAYADTSNPYATYCIRPAPAERRLIYYSLPGLPEAWPLIQALSLQEDGDELTGLMPKGSFIYILERTHIYRFTFQADPATDGFVFLSANRGCINNRCWVIVDQKAYMLDEAGIFSFDGGGDCAPLTAMIQDIFEPENQDSEYRINWVVSSLFHAVYHPGQQVIRWFVALAGQDYPRHALCMEIGQNRWWIEEYPVPIGASVLGHFNGQPRNFLGGPNGQVLLSGESVLDGVRINDGSHRGMATSAGLLTLTDNSASFNADLIGASITIVSGRGISQRRVIVAITTHSLSLDRPWLVRPDATSVYQVGGIQWRWRSKWWRFKDDDKEQPRRLEFVFEPCGLPQQLEIQLFIDRSLVPLNMGTTTDQGNYNGVSTVANSPVLLGDLTRTSGYLQRRIDGFKDLYADGSRFLQILLSGVTNQDILRIYQFAIDGVR